MIYVCHLQISMYIILLYKFCLVFILIINVIWIPFVFNIHNSLMGAS